MVALEEPPVQAEDVVVAADMAVEPGAMPVPFFPWARLTRFWEIIVGSCWLVRQLHFGLQLKKKSALGFQGI